MLANRRLSSLDQDLVARKKYSAARGTIATERWCSGSGPFQLKAIGLRILDQAPQARNNVTHLITLSAPVSLGRSGSDKNECSCKETRSTRGHTLKAERRHPQTPPPSTIFLLIHSPLVRSASLCEYRRPTITAGISVRVVSGKCTAPPGSRSENDLGTQESFRTFPNRYSCNREPSLICAWSTGARALCQRE